MLIDHIVVFLIGQGPAAESHRGIAVVVIGGQSLCLLITLLVTPVAYSLFDDMEAGLAKLLERLRRAVAWLRFRRTPGPAHIAGVGEDRILAITGNTVRIRRRKASSGGSGGSGSSRRADLIRP